MQTCPPPSPALQRHELHGAGAAAAACLLQGVSDHCWPLLLLLGSLRCRCRHCCLLRCLARLLGALRQWLVAPGAVSVCVQMDPTCSSADVPLAPCPIAAQPVHGATQAFTAPADTAAAFLCRPGSSAGCCGGCGRRSSHSRSRERRSDGKVITSESREQCVTAACVVVTQKSVNSC